MKAFRFKIALMEEHFNENYVESDEYPKAIFDGKLGNLNLHNKSKKIKTIATISKRVI